MIMDHTIGSARAEKRKNSTRRLWRRLLTASLASALAMPSLAAWGLNSPARTTAIPADVRPSPPIAHLESMPLDAVGSESSKTEDRHTDVAQRDAVGHPETWSGSDPTLSDT